MESYTGFAEVYDIFMDNVPYDEWSEYLYGLLREYRIAGGTVLELGCGTGNITERLAAKGYDMIGIDNSEEMLLAAADKRERSGYDILYLDQDMREFELYGTVNAVVSICDSLNYIVERSDLRTVFSRVREYLAVDGIFIFDFNTEYKYREVLGDQVIAEQREECSFIWENYYDQTERINEYDLTLFIRVEGDYYRKYQELHYQKGYTLDDIKEILVAAGLDFIKAYDAFTRDAPHDQSERIYVIAQEAKK